MKKRARKIDNKTIVRIAVAIAINAICAFITVPATVPFTMQTFGIFFTLEYLGGIAGSIAIALYIGLGIAGVPIFSGFKSGIGAIMSPTGGFIIAFLVIAISYIPFDFIKRGTIARYVHLALCLIVCYTIGIIWLVFVSEIGFKAAILMTIVPFILPDIIKIALAVMVSDKLARVSVSE